MKFKLILAPLLALGIAFMIWSALSSDTPPPQRRLLSASNTPSRDDSHRADAPVTSVPNAQGATSPHATLDATPLRSSDSTVEAEDAPRVRGRVVDPAGNPIANAAIKLSFRRGMQDLFRRRLRGDPDSNDPLEATTQRFPPTLETSSDSAGEFSFAPPSHPKLRLRVTHPNYMQRVPLDLSLDEVLAENEPIEVTLEEGAFLTGRVVDNAAVGVADATVSVHQRTDDDLQQRDDASDSKQSERGKSSLRTEIRRALGTHHKNVAHHKSDREGRFRCGPLLPGHYEVRVLHDLHPGATFPGDEEEPYPLSAGEELDIGDVSLQPGVALVGRVLDASGAPIAEARVAVTRPRPSVSDRVDGIREPSGFASQVMASDPQHRQRARSDVSGEFAITGQARQTQYQLRVTHSDYLPVENIVVDDNGEPQIHIGDITLPNGVGVWGSVHDAHTGEPIANAKVSTKLNERDLLALRVAGGRDRCNDRGEFKLFPLEPNSYTLVAEAEGYISASRTEHVEGTLEVRFELERGVSLIGVVVDPRGHAVAARIVAHKIGAPEPRAFRNNNFNAKTGIDGSFELIGLEPDAEYRIVANAAELAPTVIDAIRPGPSVLRIVMDLPTSVTGQVTTPQGAPVTEYRVQLQPKNPASPRALFRSRRKINDEGGTFRWDDLAAGEYQLAIQADGWAPHFETVTLAAGQPLNRRFVLSTGGRVLGLVVDVVGNPIAGARVGCYREGHRGRAITARSDDRGAFVVTGIAEGSYQVVVAHGEFVDSVREISLSSTADIDLGQVTLRSGGAIEGMVLDSSGDPLTLGLVRIEALSADKSYTAMVRDGTFQQGGLPAGEYRLCATNVASSLRWGRRSSDPPPLHDQDWIHVRVVDGALQKVQLTGPSTGER